MLELVLHKSAEGGVILALLLFNAVLAYFQEGKAEAALAALESCLALNGSAKRDGAWKTIPATELVPGDLVKLSLGAVIAADVKITEGSSWLINIGSAADLLKANTFDLLIVRPYTETVSGYDAAMYLRRKWPGIPVLIVAALLDDVELEDREALQEFKVFPKPFQVVELLDKVKEILLKFSLRDKPDRRLAQVIGYLNDSMDSTFSAAL